MSKVFLFFCCSCTILLFTIINISVGPSISGRTIFNGNENCVKISDDYDRAKDNPNLCDDDCLKYEHKWNLNRCKNEKGMYNMEYTSFIFDVTIGFICGLLGLLNLFDINKNFSSKMGLIGLGCGIIGCILTFVYIILNGIVYTNYYPFPDVYKRDKDGAFAEKNGNDFECFYFDKKKNNHALIAKYSDLIKKQYNYDKDLVKSYASDEVQNCLGNPSSCQVNGKITGNTNCKKLYVIDGPIEEIYNKDISDRFLTTLILSLFVCLANIGLAFYGFLLFRNPDESQTKTDTNVVNVQNPTSKFSVDQNLKS